MKFSAVIYTNHKSHKDQFVNSLMKGEVEHFEFLSDAKIGLFSKSETKRFVDLEERLELRMLGNVDQPLKSMSSGEQKKLLLAYVLNQPLDYLILDEPFDCLDFNSQQQLKSDLKSLVNDFGIIQIIGRSEDALSFSTHYYRLLKDKLEIAERVEKLERDLTFNQVVFPKDIKSDKFKGKELVSFKGVSVDFNGKPVLKDIHWTVCVGEFWQLIGPNGSGKSTLVGMITGDNPKAYGEELYLFGKRKGSGESIWEIKQKIGYFSPAQIYNFKGRHTVFNMLISGYNDSIGLYKKPTEEQKLLAEEWLGIIGMSELRDVNMCDINIAQQRLLMCIRAMVKFPVLLILDEPTVGLDDYNAQLFVGLVNRIASAYSMGIIYVSHRPEHNLNPDKVFHLEKI